MADGRGGPRAGTPGRLYPQRADLVANRAPAIPPSRQYGQGVQQQAVRDAGRAAAAANPPMPLPDAPPPLHRPTERPDEPITAGLSSGPGPGPEALGLGENAGEYARIAQYLPVLELVASRPGASELARNMVRLVRGSIRPGEL